MAIIRYADDDSDKAAANKAYSLLSRTNDDIHAVVERIESLRALHVSCFQDAKITVAVDSLIAATFDLHQAIHDSWEKVVT
jgi:hypothetical protein